MPNSFSSSLSCCSRTSHSLSLIFLSSSSSFDFSSQLSHTKPRTQNKPTYSYHIRQTLLRRVAAATPSHNRRRSLPSPRPAPFSSAAIDGPSRAAAPSAVALSATGSPPLPLTPLMQQTAATESRRHLASSPPSRSPCRWSEPSQLLGLSVDQPPSP
ncbi:hypothetical protein LINPERPRIM_LOCUS19461 [Linum perenne]